MRNPENIEAKREITEEDVFQIESETGKSLGEESFSEIMKSGKEIAKRNIGRCLYALAWMLNNTDLKI